MPTINVKRAFCRQKLDNQPAFNSTHKPYTDTEFDTAFEQLCFNFGIELDEITTESEIQQKQTGTHSLLMQNATTQHNNSNSDDTLYKIEIPANRADLFTGEGILNSLLNYLNPKQSYSNTQAILKKIVTPSSDKIIQIIHHNDTDSIRPYVLGCVFRNIQLNTERYKNFIEIQEKLHLLIGRNRTLVSMGTHDISNKLTYPIHYKCILNNTVQFVPLNQTQSMTVQQLYDFYANEKNGTIKNYLHIIEKQNVNVHPVIIDSNDVVLSLPPVINSNYTKISVNTKDILLEITGTNLEKMQIALNTMILSFIQYCGSIESVAIVHNNKTTISPDFETKSFDVSISYLNESIGVHLTREQIMEQLTRMELYATPNKQHADMIHVQCGVNRNDILHACDIMEDLAISTGFDNLKHTLPIHQTIGLPNRINTYSDQIRLIVSQVGFLEVLTFTLISKLENYDYLLQPNNNQAVLLANSSTIEFDCVRSTLLPGLLKTLSSNISQQLPIQIYEVGDVCIIDKSNTRIKVQQPADTGASNHRRLAAAYCGTSSAVGYGIINSVVDHVMLCNSILHMPTVKEHQASKTSTVEYTAEQLARQYYLKKSDNPTYMDAYRADIILQLQQNNKTVEYNIGTFGTLNPDVCQNFKIPHPVNCVEIDLQPFIELHPL